MQLYINIILLTFHTFHVFYPTLSIMMSLYNHIFHPFNAYILKWSLVNLIYLFIMSFSNIYQLLKLFIMYHLLLNAFLAFNYLFNSNCIINSFIAVMFNNLMSAITMVDRFFKFYLFKQLNLFTLLSYFLFHYTCILSKLSASNQLTNFNRSISYHFK